MNTKRTHRLLPLAIALVMALSLLPTKAWGYYVLQGSGTEASPYLISSAQALEALAEQVNDGALKTEGVYFRQTADIDLSGFKNNSWVPIGNATGSGGTGRTFDGIYDGNGFRIKNFVFEDTTRKYYGLFGLLSNTAVIKNLALVMLCSLCVNALAADEVKVNSALSATELEKSASAQTVQVTVAPASAVTVSNYEVKLEVPKGWTITKIENDDPNATLTAADYNLANGQMAWTSADAEDRSVSKFVTYTVEIPANTAAGTYELKVTGVNAWKNIAQDAVLTKGQHDSTLTLTVKEKTTATGYTAELSTWYTRREVGQTLTLPVYITSSEASVTTWNAATIKIKYDPRYVSFFNMQEHGLQASEVYDDKTNGVVTISRYGDSMECGNGNGTFFMAVFDCNAVGVANFQLTEARVDLQDNANVQDAPQATVKGDLVIQIGTPTYKVSGAEQELRYEPTAEAGKDFIINMQEGYVVKGLDVHYKVGGKDYTASWDADENTFIIPAQHVTGDIELYVSYHSYNITKTGSGAADVTLPQQVLDYKADYTFTLAKKAGYAYTVKVAIGGQEITCTVNEAGTEYTIPGDKILGDTVVTVTRTKEASQITFTGSTDDLVGEVSRSAPVGQDFTFTLTKDADYEYTVSAKYTESGETVPVTDNGNGTYTIAGRYITGDDISITVSKISPLDKFDFSVYEYVKVDGGKSVFLILANVKSGETLGEGKVPAYDGSNMYTDMSGRYNSAYSWLVFSESDAATLLADVKNHITLVTGEAKSYKSNNDVNYTGTADINDAQLVYNIYNAKYDSFDVVEMKMFLSADINGDKQVNSLDASAIARGTVLF